MSPGPDFLCLLKSPVQGSSALGGMILWSQLLDALLESALAACSWSQMASAPGRSNLNRTLCLDLHFALNSVYGISFVPDHVTHV